MAAQTWTTLQQTVALALTRQLGTSLTSFDTIFTTLFPQATSYAEDRINREIPFLGNRQTVTAAAITNSGTPDIPWSGFNTGSGATLATLTVPEQLYVVNSGTNVPYNRTSFDFIERFWPVPASTVAPSLSWQGGRYWATKDTTSLTIAPTVDASYSVQMTGLYYPAPISSTNTTTYLSTNYPDLLEAGCLVFLAGALTRNYGAQADESGQAMSWEAQFQLLLASAKDEEIRRRGMRPDVPMPAPPPQPAPPGR